jgi:hypothetical protein
MKLPNWFRVCWWILVTGLLTWVLGNRYPDLVAGRAVPVDIFFFAVWIALMLAPLFQEMSVLGVRFKQELEQLKSFVTTQIGDIRNEVKNAIDVRTTFSPQFTFPTPPSDQQLPQLKELINTAVADAFLAHGSRPSSTPRRLPETPDDVNLLFATRYSIEKELRRIAEARDLPLTRMSISRLVGALTNAAVIESNLADAIREVYAVCSPAIHGEPVTSPQVNFVMDGAPQLIAALQSIA